MSTPHIDTARFRQIDPDGWNEVWRIIKADRPDYAAFLHDPFIQECIAAFDATVRLPLDHIPQRAHQLIPQDVIINQ